MCVQPTWRGWLAVWFFVALGVVGGGRGLYGFLAVQDPVPGGVLVMEGWVSDADLRVADVEFRGGGYRVWCVTGEPLEKGSPLLAYHDYANLTVATYTKLGGKAGLLQPVADGIKLLGKQILTPQGADRIMFKLAPVMVVVPGDRKSVV
jgi:hypothetical protein